MLSRTVLFVLLSFACVARGHDWVRPSTTQPIPPLWGHADGVRVGLHPLRGPRGLLRVYAPYLKHDTDRVINFIAVEPIVAGERVRGLSELEHSKLDDAQGKRMWARDVQGQIVSEDDVEQLVSYVEVEPFDNGAHVYLKLIFRADRPREVAIATFAHDDSKPLDRCIITATMGNYARLRKLELNDRSVNARELWPDYRGDGFTPHAIFDLAKLNRAADGHAIAFASPDEANPCDATYADGTRSHWRYSGKVARQFWRCEDPDPALQVWVNGRYVYWKSRAPIPGGVAFENFEMIAPFKQGQEFIFGVEPIDEK